MCANLSIEADIYRIYFSNENGELCYCRVSHININAYCYASKGLMQMLEKYTKFSKSGNLPLTKQQKALLIGKSHNTEPPPKHKVRKNLKRK